MTEARSPWAELQHMDEVDPEGSPAHHATEQDEAEIIADVEAEDRLEADTLTGKARY